MIRGEAVVSRKPFNARNFLQAGGFVQAKKLSEKGQIRPKEWHARQAIGRTAGSGRGAFKAAACPLHLLCAP
jgi:hypothetical protein